MKKLLFLVLFYLSVICLHSQSNRLAFAKPLDAFHLDGELNDWPQDFKRYTIHHPVWRSAETDTQDFEAYFMVGYQLTGNKLCLAIVTQDEHPVQIEGDMELGDLYALFLDEAHHEKGSQTIRYKMSRFDRSMTGERELWDKTASTYLNWDHVAYKINQEKGRIIYEIAIKLRKPIAIGRIIGMGHLVQDVDPEKETVYAWVPSGNKDFNAQPRRLGMVQFVDAKTQFGIVSGKVAWGISNEPTAPEGIRLVEKDNPKNWMYFPVREKGGFEVTLPVGAYYAKPGKTAFFQRETFLKADTTHVKAFTIKAGETSDLGTYQLRAAKAPNFPLRGQALSNFSEQSKSLIDSVIQSYMEYYQIEGVAFAGLKKGEIIYEKQYGVANSFTQEPITDKTLFEVASITKPTFAYAVLRLVDKEIIDLDTPLYTYLPWDEIETMPYAKLLTARLVLSHQTGLPNWGEMRFLHKPGEGYTYSGSAYQYLGRVLEKITGKDIHTILQEEVVQPLILKHFYYQAHPYVRKHKAHGHFNGFPGGIDMPKKPWVAGCLITNARGLSEFVFALKDRKGLTPKTYTEMFRKAVEIPLDEQENNWGFQEYMGLGLFFEKGTDGLVFRHSGNNGDFKSVFRYNDDTEIGYILLANGNTGQFLLDAIEKVLYTPSTKNK